MTLSLPKWRSKNAQIKALTDNPERHSLSLGCGVCVLRAVCGGLHVAEPLLFCSDLCCGKPHKCSRVCRAVPERYVHQMREIGDFSFDDIPRTDAIASDLTSGVAPLIYHGSRREKSTKGAMFAVRLADLVNFRTGKLRFGSRSELAAHFRLPKDAKLVVSGVDHDHRIELWWSLSTQRIPIIRALAALGVEAVTTPNFSVPLDRPRTDDLHAIKRIAIAFEEFQREGLLCALHPNGRTQRDFERWKEFVIGRDEVKTLAYEFITGAGRKDRMNFHLDQLVEIARDCSRPLDIIVRGDPKVVPILHQSFRNVVYIETTSFLKTIQRQRAIRITNSTLCWQPHPLHHGAPLDELLAHNQREQLEYLRAMHFGIDAHFPAAA